MKIINYYEPRAEKLVEPMAGGITHIAKVYYEINVDGINKALMTGESWGKSKEDAEITAIENFRDWAEDNELVFKRDL